MQFYESFEDMEYLYLFIELCDGGSLRIEMKKGISEWEALRIFKQLISALVHIHDDTKKKKSKNSLI